MSKFRLVPYMGSKPVTNGWFFQVRPYGKIVKAKIVSYLLSLYPDLQIKNVRIIKTIKRNKILLVCNREAPWNSKT